MEDFLKDRPVLTAPPATVPASVGDGSQDVSPFGALRRSAPDGTGRTLSTRSAGGAHHAGDQMLTGDHGATVKTVVEQGRVTRIIVTCSCGKITELACNY